MCVCVRHIIWERERERKREKLFSYSLWCVLFFFLFLFFSSPFCLKWNCEPICIWSYTPNLLYTWGNCGAILETQWISLRANQQSRTQQTGTQSTLWGWQSENTAKHYVKNISSTAQISVLVGALSKQLAQDLALISHILHILCCWQMQLITVRMVILSTCSFLWLTYLSLAHCKADTTASLTEYKFANVSKICNTCKCE